MNNSKHIELWDKFLKFVGDNIPVEQYRAWFQPITSMSFIDGALTIHVPSPYFVQLIEERYASLMQSGLRKVYGENVQVYFNYNQVAGQADTQIEQRGSNPSVAVQRAQVSGVNPFVRATKLAPIDPQLNPRYTFENYCDGMCNKVARSIGEAIASDPKLRTFNPLFIFGPSGCGKTHLIQAIGIRIKERFPDMRVLYVSARLFESHFTDNFKDHINDFMFFYQSIDVLIIDDIQDFIGKKKTQNAFYHIFNHLVQNQKQLILSSDCRPSQMEGMEVRLLSRFTQGMTCELERPDYDLRRKVLMLKSEQDGLSLSEEVIDYIASNVTTSIRDLEGIMVSLIAHAAVLNSDIDLPLARTVVANAVKVTKRQLNFEMIAEAVAEHYNVETDLIFTKLRKREVSDARQILMFLAKKHTKMSLKAIGQRLDRTHATVLYACSQTAERIGIDKKLRSDIDEIEKALFA